MQIRWNWIDDGNDVAVPAYIQTAAPPLVSVVIPCYNSARYLADTLDAVLSQTHPAVEIIVVDDGSTDTTPEIAQSYPITYVRQRNRGTSVARNKGLSLSHGRYILFLDTDDRLLPCCIASGVALLETFQTCAIAVGEHFYVAADGTRLGQSCKFSDPRAPYLRLLEHNFIETTSSALIRRSALIVLGGLCETLEASAAHELFRRLARQCRTICHTTVITEHRLDSANTNTDTAIMLTTSYRALLMEKPYLGRQPKRLRSYRKGVKHIERRFGRRLTVDLFHSEHTFTKENKSRLRLLLEHYPVGAVAATLAMLLPRKLRLLVSDGHERRIKSDRITEPSGLQQTGPSYL